MHAGMMAISSISSSSSSSGNVFTATRGGEGGRTNNDNNGLQLLFVSSRHTSHVHCVDVTVQCTPSNPLHSTTTTTLLPPPVGHRHCPMEMIEQIIIRTMTIMVWRGGVVATVTTTSLLLQTHWQHCHHPHQPPIEGLCKMCRRSEIITISSITKNLVVQW